MRCALRAVKKGVVRMVRTAPFSWALQHECGIAIERARGAV